MNDPEYAIKCPEYKTWLEGDTRQCIYCVNLDEKALHALPNGCHSKSELKCLNPIRNAKRKVFYDSLNEKQTTLTIPAIKSNGDKST